MCINRVKDVINSNNIYIIEQNKIIIHITEKLDNTNGEKM